MTFLERPWTVRLFAAAFAAATAVHIGHVALGEGSHGLVVDLVTALAMVVIGLLAWGLWREVGRSHARLARTDAHHRSIVETAGEAIIVIDEQATIMTFNTAAERVFGYAAIEIVGSSLERLMTDGARHAHAAYLAQHGVTAMVEAVRLRSVHRGLRKSGEVFPFELTMAEWTDGERRLFTGIMRDVSERERAAAALRESQARYTGLYENSRDLLVIFALEGSEFVVECMNGRAEQLTGSTREAVAGLSPARLVGSEEGRGLKRALVRCLDTAEAIDHELSARLDGSMARLRVTLSPMRDGAGEVTRVLARGEVLTPERELQTVL
jgi:PAS domain S-box-containing protein